MCFRTCQQLSINLLKVGCRVLTRCIYSIENCGLQLCGCGTRVYQRFIRIVLCYYGGMGLQKRWQNVANLIQYGTDGVGMLLQEREVVYKLDLKTTDVGMLEQVSSEQMLQSQVKKNKGRESLWSVGCSNTGRQIYKLVFLELSEVDLQAAAVTSSERHCISWLWLATGVTITSWFVCLSQAKRSITINLNLQIVKSQTHSRMSWSRVATMHRSHYGAAKQRYSL